MVRKDETTAAVAAQQTLVDGVAKHFLQKHYGPEGMPWGTRFTELEELAVQVGQAISRSMMDQALARQAAAVPTEAQACSTCGRPTEPADHPPGPRAVTGRAGTVQWDEPSRYCPTCRAAFFPSVPGVGAGSGRLQPGGA